MIDTPNRRRSQIYYKIDEADHIKLSHTVCHPFDIGINRIGDGTGRSDADKSLPEIDSLNYMIVRNHPSRFGNYEIISGLSLFERARSAADPDLDHGIPARVLELSDEESFAIAMGEYLKYSDFDILQVGRLLNIAHKKYYKYGFSWMAQRLAVDPERLRSLIEIARLPEEITACFSNLSELDWSMITPLAQRLRNLNRRSSIMARATLIAADREERQRRGWPSRTAADIVDDLCSQSPGPRFKKGTFDVRTDSGALVARVTVESPGIGSIAALRPTDASADQRRKAMLEALEILENGAPLKNDGDVIIR